MAHDGIWIFVDDQPDAAKAFADELNEGGSVRVEVMSPTHARAALLLEKREPAGVLMDVDLSASSGECGTGPGIAQDIRVKQKNGSAREFPLVRFAAADLVARNVLGDPTSDDLFELKINKEELREHRDEMIARMLGLRVIYDKLIHHFEQRSETAQLLADLFGLNEDALSSWCHDAMTTKVLAGMAHTPHVAAGAFCRLFINPYGLLIDERLLAVRLGVDLIKSDGAWTKLLELTKEFKYCGAGGEQFNRWWARGLEDWWFSNVDGTVPLTGRSVEERIDLLTRKTGIQGLQPLPMLASEASHRPWRFCRLGLEKTPPEFIPVDPSEGVRMVSQVDFPPWIDPLCASLKLALRAQYDLRLVRRDLARFKPKGVE